MDNKALLVLERPWYSLSENPPQCSVLPFFQSMERLGEPISVYHASFFEREGFRAALNHLMGHSHERAILYVASHGDGVHLAGDDGAPRIRLETALAEVFAHASIAKNLEGVILGSCFLGMRESAIEGLFAGTRLRWVVAYQAAIEWLPSMLIDMKVVSRMASADDDEFASLEGVSAAFAEALELFNPVAPMAEDLVGDLVGLDGAIRIWARCSGKGKHGVHEITEKVADMAWGLEADGDEEDEE